jgi:crossover junction endodeoxyribonuclease RuvC
MRILGIDPGLRLTGYGVIDCRGTGKPALVDGGVIRLPDHKTSIADRLVELERELQSIVAEYKPAACAVETLYSHTAHPRTSILMGHARGVILLVARRNGLGVHEFAASRIKMATVGHGHAAKGQMQRAVQAIWGLPEPPEPPDVADALAVALCCANALLSVRQQTPAAALDMLTARRRRKRADLFRPLAAGA